MATAELEKTLKEVNELVSHFVKIPETKMWIDYDREADVLYISFKRPQRATDSEMAEVVIRGKKDKTKYIAFLAKIFNLFNLRAIFGCGSATLCPLW